MVRSVLVVLAFLAVVAAHRAAATPEYAERSGRTCASCHRDAGGGGPLTPGGEQFVAAGHRWPELSPSAAPVVPRPAPGLRILRFVLGFLHLTTAVVWLGTIFYVHLILRPQYALGGLPKSELRLAWACMAVLGVTGVPLTYLRFHTPHGLLESRSGYLLLTKIGLYLFLVLSAAVVTRWIGPRLKRLRSLQTPNNGRDGRPAWVQVGERIYDLSASPRWKNGEHFRRHQAGGDLTEALAAAPHGPEKLAGFPSHVASVQGASVAEPVVKAFYLMAYTNLIVALGVLVIIALWRWG